uniref:DUF4371 domain-containing protein n=1 Tax=Sinocyclocheilus anshuiensis TaxID=1608454 RepID=A0A671MPV2_9TELE
TGKETIDSDLMKQMDSEREYWKQVLRRVVSVIKFLGERGLAFRGSDELLGSAHNGNFLGILELLAEYDPFLGTVSYLLSTTCEEFIQLMGEKIKQTIAKEIQNAKYFSVIVDSTLDFSHVDQLTFIFRFVDPDWHVVERFLAFEPIESHTGESLADCILAMVDSLGLDLSNCRGQSYDNASNMSGKYKGVQAHLKRRNPVIHFVHSLNLVGTNAMTLKSLSDTRWSARAESCKALWKHYAQVREALGKISNDMQEKRETSSEASALCNKLDTIEMAFMAHFWNMVLDRFQATSQQLQRHDIDIFTATPLISSLQDFVAAQRDGFEAFERAAMNVSGVSLCYKRDIQRAKKRKTMADESAEPDVLHDGRDQFRVETFNVIIDKLTSCLQHRSEAYKHLTELFGVLFMPENVDITASADALSASYPLDLDKSLADELTHFRSFILFVTLPVTNCEGERSFSKMSRVKNELRTRMCQERLQSLSLMAIESELLKELRPAKKCISPILIL